jgi:hypothetical protein
MADDSDGHTLFFGTQLADTITGTSGDDHIRGFEGGDLLKGLGGNDIMEGGLGPDIIEGGAGNDILVGGPGEDEFEPGPGNDLVFGGGGPDAVLIVLEDNAVDFDRADGGPGTDALVLDITGLPDASGLIAAIRALHEEAMATGIPLDLGSLGFHVTAEGFEVLHMMYGPGLTAPKTPPALGGEALSEPTTWGRVKALYGP